MNVENIKLAIEHVKTLNPEQFSMLDYRKTSTELSSIECKSVGCVIGHCTVLDYDNILMNFFDYENNLIQFDEWSHNFFGLNEYKQEEIWDYMFGCEWSNNPITNTPEHAVYRMQRIVDGYDPEFIHIEIRNEIII